MVIRKQILKRIEPFVGKPPVKVITGLRRSGKSVLVRQIIDRLASDGVPRQNIVYIDLESLENDAIRTYADLDARVRAAADAASGRLSVFVDEVQTIPEWERAVAAWSGDPERYDVYITGSNSMMFSGALATRLTGRYVEIPVYPLSFAEFVSASDDGGGDASGTGGNGGGGSAASVRALFGEYVRFGGMPGLLPFGRPEEAVATPFLAAVHDSILLKDVVERERIRNVSLLRGICAYLYDGVGSPVSATSVSKFLKGQRLAVNVQTVLNYMAAVESAQLVEGAARFDVRGRRQLEYNKKYYATDVGLRNAIVGMRATDFSHLLENVVFIELRRRGWRVSTGEVGGREIDFVAERGGERRYYQVTRRMDDEATAEREVRSLLAAQDGFPKCVLALDCDAPGEYAGVPVVPLTDFLLDEGD